MLTKVMSYGLSGIDGFQVTVEVNLSFGMPGFEIVGLPDASVKESRERVRAALKNCDMGFPSTRITVNLAPADLKKEGPAFDLPIALGILACDGKLKLDGFGDTAVLGELSLDGSISNVRGALPMVISALEQGVKRVMLPESNINEVRCLSGIDILPVNDLKQAAAHFAGTQIISPITPMSFADIRQAREFRYDFADVKGQENAKRALEIAAAGGHNVLMIGAPGSGKTLMAQCMPSILPEMSFKEALETTRIHSVAGSVPDTGLLTIRPFRAPHHTASNSSLVGGGASAMPGEISKAHNGVLFLDELPEYKRDVLEAMRQPLEDGEVTIARVNAQSTYPARIMLICSMNPCPCGNMGSRNKQCRCSPAMVRRYLNRISGPLLDRIDMHIEVDSIPTSQLADEDRPMETSAQIRERVEAARNAQRKRYRDSGEDIYCNAQLTARNLNEACPVDADAKKILLLACDKMSLSNRAYTRILKVSRTIADMDGEDVILARHVSEAVQYRTLDRKYWG